MFRPVKKTDENEALAKKVVQGMSNILQHRSFSSTVKGLEDISSRDLLPIVVSTDHLLPFEISTCFSVEQCAIAKRELTQYFEKIDFANKFKQVPNRESDTVCYGIAALLLNNSKTNLTEYRTAIVGQTITRDTTFASTFINSKLFDVNKINESGVTTFGTRFSLDASKFTQDELTKVLSSPIEKAIASFEEQNNRFGSPSDIKQSY